MLLSLVVACFTDTAPDEPGDTDRVELTVGLYHRATADACAPDRPATEPAEARCGTDPEDTCTAHEDCTDGANGRCTLSGDTYTCGCTYDECTADADCGGTAVCACAGVAPHEDWTNNSCVRSDCRTDADCTSGLCLADRVGCGTVEAASSLTSTGFFCATDADTCRSDEVCGEPGDFCVHGQEGWTCSTNYSMTCE